MLQVGFNCSSNIVPKASVQIDDFKHALFIGKTGNGKTTGGINPVINSRIEAGYGMLVFDEKGKEHRVVKSMASQHGRLEDVIELGKPHGIKINLLSHLSERQMENFIRRLIKRSQESYWTESSINMVLPLIRWLLGIKKLHTFGVETFDMGKTRLHNSHIDTKTSVKHEWTVSTDPLTAKELSEYFHNSAAFALVSQFGHFYTQQLISSILASITVEHTKSIEQMQAMLIAEELIDNIEELEIILKGKMIKSDLSESSGNNGNYFMIASILSVVGSNSYINYPFAKDLHELLSEGKIVIINTETFSTPILSTLLDQTLESLSTRSKQKDAHPISIIVDEANRVLTAESDIRIDVLRESKVEVIMATQNHEQMISKMGDDKWWSFAKNFNTCYHFMGKNSKGTFKVFDENNDSEIEATGMFYQEDDLDDVEWRYQQMHGYYRYYTMREQKVIVLYDHILMEQARKILLFNIETKQTSSVTLLPDANCVKTKVLREYCIALKETKCLAT
jgi:hypothetical protein